MKKSDKEKMLQNGIQSLKARPGGSVLESMFDRNEEFVYLPLADIQIGNQPRKAFSTESDKFKGMVASIQKKGVIEPVLVNKRGKEYFLISGERRLTATKKAGLPTIPARIFRDMEQQDILALQLIENLDREDLNPIDEAQAYLEYYRSFDGKQKAGTQDMINALVDHKTSKEKQSATPIIGVIMQIFGKSPSTLVNLLSLIMLKIPLQEAIKDGKVSLTQGYVLAENKEHPRFEEVAERVLKEGLTVEKIRALFKEPTAPAQKPAAGRPVTFKSARKKFTSWRESVLKSVPNYSQKERGELVKEVESLLQELKRG